MASAVIELQAQLSNAHAQIYSQQNNLNEVQQNLLKATQQYSLHAEQLSTIHSLQKSIDRSFSPAKDLSLAGQLTCPIILTRSTTAKL